MSTVGWYGVDAWYPSMGGQARYANSMIYGVGALFDCLRWLRSLNATGSFQEVPS